MSPFIVDFLYGSASALSGAAGASYLWFAHFRRKTVAYSTAEARRAAEVLVRLQDLAARVAFDVDEHSSQVEKVNDQLTACDKRDPSTIVDVVAKLIEANEQMHNKLVSTEAKLREQAQEIQVCSTEARTDALTLLANRRAFDDELTRRFAEFAGHGRTLSVIMADVDHFKNINDAYGHQVGDEVLRDVAKLLRRKMREMDFVARYGGEEFAIILPGTTSDDACETASRAREAIAEAYFHHGWKKLEVTLSFGVAEAPGSRNGAALFARADKAMYAAKAAGRNCVFLHDGKGIRHFIGEQRSELSEVHNLHDESTPAEQKSIAKLRPALDVESSERRPKYIRAVEREAHTDLPSRTIFCQQVRSRTTEWRRGGATFSVVLVDLNQPSDEDRWHGDFTGELPTAAAARFFAATIRDMDVVGHYAPGCFALLLPSADLAVAIRVAERFQDVFPQYGLTGQARQSRLSLNVGIAQVAEIDDSISVIKCAEAALHQAARHGAEAAFYHDGMRCMPVAAMLATVT